MGEDALQQTFSFTAGGMQTGIQLEINLVIVYTELNILLHHMIHSCTPWYFATGAENLRPHIWVFIQVLFTVAKI